MGRVSGKVAIVTGGGGGLGLAQCRLLIEEGATVVMTDVSDSTAVANQIGAHFLLQDVSKELDWQRVMDYVQSEFGQLDILVNNAGIALFADIENTSLEQWQLIQNVNSTGTFLGCRSAVEAMKEGGGSIINISSVAAMIGMSSYAAYCASKGATRALSKVVAVHCQEKGYNIRCNSIHPGAINTQMAANALVEAGIEERDSAITAIGEPEDVAYMVLYLASDESKFVSGSEMLVDSAMVAS